MYSNGRGSSPGGGWAVYSNGRGSTPGGYTVMEGDLVLGLIQ